MVCCLGVDKRVYVILTGVVLTHEPYTNTCLVAWQRRFTINFSKKFFQSA